MKHKGSIRLLSWLLALCMLISIAPMASAAPEDGSNVQFYETEVPEGVDLGTERTPGKTADKAVAEETIADTDLVRVAIVLMEPSVLEKGFSTMGLAENIQAMTYSDTLRSSQDVVAQRISKKLGQELDVSWNLTLVANMISVTIPYGRMAELETIPGVKSVHLEPVYQVPETQAVEEQPQMSTAMDMTGTAQAWASGYTGAGMRIAVIDTGTAADHRSFDEGAWCYSLEQNAAAKEMSQEDYIDSLDLLDVAELEELLPRLHITGATAEDLYHSGKEPFAYNYLNKSLVTDHSDGSSEHGSHVAGTATANRYVPEADGYVSALESVYVTGQAPDAQLITMKVIDAGGTTSASDWIVAVEDALLMGCDAINMSLGSSSPGYSRYYDDYFDGVFAALSETDTVISISAGNNYSLVTPGTSGAPGYSYASDVSLDTVGSPGSFANAFTVASVENTGMVSSYLKVADSSPIFYTERLFGNVSVTTLDREGMGTTYTYVILDPEVTQEQLDALDLTDKILIYSRGTSLIYYFYEGHQYCQEHGAAAFAVYHSTSGRFAMDLSGSSATIPAFTLTLADGQALKAAAEQTGEGIYTGQLTIYGTVSPVDIGRDGYEMSGFSSWGVPSNLTLKPEITAPGGNIYSVNGRTTDGYELMSGTSMASPQVAGMTAILAQYIEENGLAEKTGLSQRQLIQSLLMGTAEPIFDTQSGSYYSMLKQGAGLANVGNALGAASFILVDGQPDGKVKAELGDDPDRTGVYTTSFTVHNFSDETVSYRLEGKALTQDTFLSYPNAKAAAAEDTSNLSLYMDYATRELDASIVATFSGQSASMKEDLSIYDFDGDGDTDDADGQALLEYVMGVREEVADLENADLSGDGTVNSYDVHLFLAKLAGQTVTIPAGEEVTVTVTITLSDREKAWLDENFTGGAYVEAYLRLIAIAGEQGDLTSDLGIPIFAFYGSWTDGSMFDHGTMTSYLYNGETPYFFPFNFIYYYSPALGYSDTYYGNVYIYDQELLPERNALSQTSGTYIEGLSFVPMRNAIDSRVIIRNADTGEIYREYKTGEQTAAYCNASTGTIYGSDREYYFTAYRGTDAEGKSLPEGARVEVAIQLAPEYNLQEDGSVDWNALGQGSYMSETYTIDNTAPEVLSVSNEILNGEKLYITVQDNFYTAGVMLFTADGKNRLDIKAVNQTESGVTGNVEFDLSKYAGDTFTIAVYDYAENFNYYTVTISGRPAQTITQKFRTYNTTYGFQAFDAGSDKDEVNLSKTIPSYSHVCYVDGFVFGMGNTELWVYPEEDNYEDRVSVGKGGYAIYKDITVDWDTGTMYAVRLRSPVALDSVDMFTGATSRVTTFSYNGASVMVRSVSYAGDGLFYALANDRYLYTMRLDENNQAVLEQIGKVSDTVSGSSKIGGYHTFFDRTEKKLYWMDYYGADYKLYEINTTTAECTETATLSRASNGAFVLDYDAASDPGPHWYDPVDAVTSFTVSSSALNLMSGESATVAANIQPWNVSNNQVTWTTSDPAVAVVKDGVVTGVSQGTATITAVPELAPELAQEIQVAVTNADVVVNGVFRDADGKVKLYGWDFSDSFQAGTVVAMDSVLSAVRTPDGLWVMANDEDHTLNRIDETTGEVLATSAYSGGEPMGDMTASQQFGGVLSLYGLTSILAPWDPAGGAVERAAFNFAMLLSSRGATAIVGLASGGKCTYEDEDEEVEYDAERLYILDNKNNLYVYDLYNDGSQWKMASEGMYRVSGLPSTYPVRSNTLLDSLSYNQGTRSLTLSHFNSAQTEVYLIRPAGTAWSAFCLGSSAEDIYPMTICDSSFGASAITAAEEPLTVGGVTLAAEPLTFTDSWAVPNGVAVEKGEAEAVARIQADVPTTNGVYRVEYDANALSLRTAVVGGTAQVVTEESGAVNLAFANADAIAAGETIATLTFDRKTPGPTDVKITTLAVNDSEEISQEIGTVACNHTHTEVRDEKAPGFETEGYTGDTYCLDCGEMLHKGEAIAPLGCPSAKFTDVDTSRWYHDAIDYVVDRKIMVGMSDTAFGPENTLTRAQVVKVLHRLAGSPEAVGEAPFTDVQKGRYYEAAVAWAYEQGIVRGITETTFAPDTPVTREQMVTLLYRFAEFSGADTTARGDLSTFADAEAVSKYAREALSWAVAEEIILGMDGGIAPQGTATRAQFAAIVMRFLED